MNTTYTTFSHTHMHMVDATGNMPMVDHWDGEYVFTWDDADPYKINVAHALGGALAQHVATWILSTEQLVNVMHGTNIDDETIRVAHASVSLTDDGKVMFTGRWSNDEFTAQANKVGRALAEALSMPEPEYREVEFRAIAMFLDEQPLKDLVSHVVTNMPKPGEVKTDLDDELARILDDGK